MIMINSTFKRIGVLAGLLTSLSLWGQNSISVSCPIQAGPGDSVTCSVALSLGAGVKVDGLTFGAAVTPNGSAPVLTQGQLNFNDAVGGGFSSTGSTYNQISVVWFSLSPALSGTVTLGSVAFVLPVSAVIGKSYSMTIAGASASLGNSVVSIGIGSPATIEVFSPCDVKQAGITNVADVQEIINEALGRAPAANDLNHDGVVNVVDAQIVIDAALGLGCSGS